MLGPNQKLSINWDASGDQPERFPDGYYIAVVMEWHVAQWVNSGLVFHVATLAELDALLAKDTPAPTMNPRQLARTRYFGAALRQFTGDDATPPVVDIEPTREPGGFRVMAPGAAETVITYEDGMVLHVCPLDGSTARLWLISRGFLLRPATGTTILGVRWGAPDDSDFCVCPNGRENSRTFLEWAGHVLVRGREWYGKRTPTAEDLAAL